MKEDDGRLWFRISFVASSSSGGSSAIVRVREVAGGDVCFVVRAVHFAEGIVGGVVLDSELLQY